MMLIKDYLEQYKSYNPFKQIILSINLYKSINDMSTIDPKWSFFVWLVKRSLNGDGRSTLFPIDPDELLLLCTDLGLDTIEALEEWVSAVNGKNIVDRIDPIINIKRYEKIAANDIKNLIINNCNMESDCVWNFGDGQYSLIDSTGLTEILEKSPINKYRYIIDAHDCEDYQRELRAWISSKYLGDLSVGTIDVNLYDKNEKPVFAHALIIVVLEDMSIVIVEPQTDKVYGPDYKFGFEQLNYKIRFVNF